MHVTIADAEAFRREGARAFALGEPIFLCPYIRSGSRPSLYVLDPAREWRNGCIDAKDHSVPRHDAPGDV